MSHLRITCLTVLACGLAAGCARTETRQFEVPVDESFYTVTQTRMSNALTGQSIDTSLSVRVNGEDLPCAELPCAEEVREAGGSGIEDFRLPPEGADLSTI